MADERRVDLSKVDQKVRLRVGFDVAIKLRYFLREQNGVAVLTDKGLRTIIAAAIEEQEIKRPPKTTKAREAEDLKLFRGSPWRKLR